MDVSRNVRIARVEGTEDSAGPEAHLRPHTPERFSAPLRKAMLRTRHWLLGEQHADGHWVGELEGDTILESEYILLLAWLGRHDSDVARKAAQYIVNQQLPGGGWAMYPGGTVEISGSVKAYFALKLTGHDPSAEYMQRAREAILAHGGADAVNSFTRFYLALLGQISYEQCPAVPPELVLLPTWFPVNLYAMSAWSRTIVVPLSIMSACQPKTSFEPRLGIRELFLRAPEDWPALRCPGLKAESGLLSWDRFFRTVDKLLKACQRRRWLPLRKKALAVAEQWMLERFQGSEGLGAIFPPMVWSVIALRCLGYQDDSPELRYCYETLEGLYIEEGDTLRLQPCKSPVWDTAIALRALADSGLAADHPATSRGVDWLLSKQITKPGDWSKTVQAEPGAWCFEHANDPYPDVDDTAMAAMALAEQFATSQNTHLQGFHLVSYDEREASPSPLTGEAARPLRRSWGEGYGAIDHTSPPHPNPLPPGERGLVAPASTPVHAVDQALIAVHKAERWILAMQNRDGGWGAFDRDNDREFLCHVPFADHNAMIDPSTPDLTGRVLEALGKLGHRAGHPAVERALQYLRDTQEADGSWFGRWGVNYIYGTWQVLTGLAAVGIPTSDPMMQSGAHWLLAYQQAIGAWGESADSYADPSLRGQGPATASQTAWAVMGLMAAGYHDHPATEAGVRWLVEKQNDDGSWDETEFTGTGFPRVFYLRYHLYCIYFPLMAISRYAGKTLNDECRTMNYRGRQASKVTS